VTDPVELRAREAGGPGPAISLGPGEFARAFPFHFACDRNLRVLQVGVSLARVAPEVQPGACLRDSFTLTRPTRELTIEFVDSLQDTLALLEHRSSSIHFRGQFARIQDGAGFVFLGSPWFTTSDALEAAGLSLADFAPQDPIADLLLISQTQQISIENLWQLNEQLSQQRETLRRTESLYRSAIAAGYAVPYQESFLDDSFSYVGEGFEELTGCAPGTLRPSQLRALEASSAERTGTTKILRSGDAALRRNADYAFAHRDGGIRWFNDSSVLLTSAQGQPTGAIGILYDITSRKESEERLRASEEEARLLALVAARTSSGVMIVDAEQRIMWINDAFGRLTGFTSEKVVGRRMRDFLHALDIGDAAFEATQAAMSSGQEFHSEIPVRRADGRITWVSAEIQTLRDKNGRITGYIGVGTDISSTKEYEQQLARLSRELEAILGVIPGGVVALSEDGRVAYFNPAFQLLLGCSREELQTMTSSDLDRHLAGRCDPADRPSGFLELAEGDLDVLRISRPVPATIARTVRIVKDRDAASQWRAYYLHDITREAEIDRMKSEFLSLAAHELRTPMSSVHGFAELLVSRDFDAETSRTIARTIHRQSLLLVNMVNELLDLARIESGRRPDFAMESQQLEPIVREVVDSVLMPGDSRRAELVPSDAGSLFVRVDGAKLRNAVTNVLANAYKYSRQQGVIRVWLPQRSRRGRPEVGVRISDEGIGMSPEQLSRVFERFYRADPSSEIPGTGLGMTLVKSIVEAMGGTVEIASEVGRGTTVTLWLPVDGG